MHAKDQDAPNGKNRELTSEEWERLADMTVGELRRAADDPTHPDHENAKIYWKTGPGPHIRKFLQTTPKFPLPAVLKIASVTAENFPNPWTDSSNEIKERFEQEQQRFQKQAEHTRAALDSMLVEDPMIEYIEAQAKTNETSVRRLGNLVVLAQQQAADNKSESRRNFWLTIAAIAIPSVIGITQITLMFIL